MNLDIALIILSGISLCVSLFVASTNFWSSRPNIKLTQSKMNKSWILKTYDGSLPSEKYKKMSPNMDSIALVEVIITNDSSLPISVLEFNTKGAHPFNSDSYTDSAYKVTPKHGGPINFGNLDNPLNYIKPEFTLDPYTSRRGYILFWMHDKESIKPGTHKLSALTSRKEFTLRFKIKDSFESKEQHLYMSPEFLPYY